MSATYFDMDLYYRVRDERRKVGLPVANLQEDIKDHELSEGLLKSLVTGNIYGVVRVWKEYYKGWFIRALLVSKGSHSVVIVSNINCEEPSIVERSEYFQHMFEVVKPSHGELKERIHLSSKAKRICSNNFNPKDMTCSGSKCPIKEACNPEKDLAPSDELFERCNKAAEAVEVCNE